MEPITSGVSLFLEASSEDSHDFEEKSGHTHHVPRSLSTSFTDDGDDSHSAHDRPKHRRNISGRLSRQMQVSIRALVSKKKRRFVDDHHEFNLDLSYITSDIITMGFPSEGSEAVFRNPMVEVQRFLELRHKNHFKIFNLCSERDYDDHHFTSIGGKVGRYPFDDHNVPSIEQMYRFCVDCRDFRAEHQENVVVVHCKAGKGRTGLMVAALLVFDHAVQSADEAMVLFGNQRTLNNKGVTIPSQRRFVEYFYKLHKYARYDLCLNMSVTLEKIRILGTPDFDIGGGWHTYFVAKDLQGNVIYDYSTRGIVHQSPDMGSVDFGPLDIELCGCVKLIFYHKDFLGNEEKACWCWLHTAFVGGFVHLARHEIDQAVKDKHYTIFPPKFAIEFWFGGDSGHGFMPTEL